MLKKIKHFIFFLNLNYQLSEKAKCTLIVSASDIWMTRSQEFCRHSKSHFNAGRAIRAVLSKNLRLGIDNRKQIEFWKLKILSFFNGLLILVWTKGQICPPPLSVVFFTTAQKLLGVGSWKFVNFPINV